MVRLVAIGFAWTFAALAADEPRLEIDSGGHQGTIRMVSFTHDGKYVVSAGDDKDVRVWDIATGKTVRKILGQVGDGTIGKILAAAVSPDERYLAVGGFLSAVPDEGTIRIHDFRSGEVVALLKGHTNTVSALAFSPDSRYLVSGGHDHTVHLWDVSTWKQIEVLSGHRGDIYSVGISPDSQRIVSASDDKTLRLWSIDGQTIREMTGHQGLVRAVAFSPDGQFIASGSTDKTIRLWDAKTGEFIKVLANPRAEVRGISFGPDGLTLVAGSVSRGIVCRAFEVPSGQLIASFSGHKNSVLTTAFSPDGKLVASGGGDGEEIRIWDPSSGEQARELVGGGNRVWAVGFGRDGGSIAFGTTFYDRGYNNRGPLEKTVLLDTGLARTITVGEPVRDEAQFLRAVSRNADLALAVRAGAVYESNVLQIIRAGKIIRQIPRDSTSGIRHLAYSLSPDGNLVASGGGNGYFSLYATVSGKEVAECVGHTADVLAVAFSPDGKTLVSGSADQTVRLWDVAQFSCKPLVTIFAGSDNEWVAWTPQGYYTSSANGDKYIGWRVNQGEDKQAQFYPAAQFQKQFYRPDVVAEFLESRDIEAAVRTANEQRGGEVRTQPVLTASDVTNWIPPMISIISPYQDHITVSQKIFALRAEVRSKTLPIADVKVLLNGVQKAGKGAIPAATGQRRPVQLELELEEGRNIISIIASNEKAMSEPETRTIVYNPGSGGTASDKPKLIALAIGISNYERKEMTLKYGDADATAMEAALKSQIDPQHILYGDVLVHVLTNEGANRSGILKELDWLSKQGTQRDTRMLFLSGHGDVDGRKNYFFLADQHDPDDYDLDDIPWDLLIRKLTASGGKSVLFVDTCHAAAISGRKDDKKPLSQVIKEMDTEATGLATFAAATGAEDSVEMDQFAHGAFTEAVLEGLAGEADLNRDGIIETSELGTWITNRVREITGGKQHAIYEPTPGLPSFAIFRVKR